MLCVIFTEAMLFVMLFFAYYYLGHDAPNWAAEPPKLMMALVMLAVLISSSLVLHWGERQIDKARTAAARAAVAVTALLGLAFLAIQVFEYRERLLEIRPDTDAYGSMFYLMTGFHGLHVIGGLLFMVAVIWMVSGRTSRAPVGPTIEVCAYYWHFVDVVWVIMFANIYLLK